MAYRWKNKLTPADITPKSMWMNRRSVLAGLAGAGALSSVGGAATAEGELTPNAIEAVSYTHLTLPTNREV